MVCVNKVNLAKNPEKIGIPAIESNAAVKMPASKGFDLPNPLKLTISSLFLLRVTKIMTAKAAIPAKAYAAV